MNYNTNRVRCSRALSGLYLTLAGAATATAQVAPATPPQTPTVYSNRARLNAIESMSSLSVMSEDRPLRLASPSSSVLGGTEAAGGAPIYAIDPFTSYTLAHFWPLPTHDLFNGQINPFGNAVQAVDFVGVVDHVTWSNYPSTPPPGGEPSLSLLRHRLTISTGFMFTMKYRFTKLGPGPSAAQHARVSTDWYLDDALNLQSIAAGCTTTPNQGDLSDRVLFGGENVPGLEFALSTPPTGALDTFVILGPDPNSTTNGLFFATPRVPSVCPFPVGEWFTLMSILAKDANGADGSGVFIKTPQTIANGVLDPRMAAGDIIPTDKNPAGWLNIYPGVVDDPLTSVIEGVGLAFNATGGLAPTTGAFGMAPLILATTTDLIELDHGYDPANTYGTYIYMDNLTIAGQAPHFLGDTNGDGVVDGADIAIILNDFGNGPNGNGNPISNPAADINGDGVVDGADLAIILNSFGAGCP